MFNPIGNQHGIGAPLGNNQIGGEPFIRHISDKLHFRFTEGSGTTCRDLSRENNDGTFGATTAAPTWKRNSLYFDGGDYVDLTGISHGISTGEFTFCFNLSNYNVSTTLFSQETVQFYFYNHASDYITMISFRISDAVSTIKPIVIQITRDSSGNFECYINGKPQKKGYSAQTDFTYDGSSVIYLGSYLDGSLSITGTMDSFRILNKGLSGIECFQEYLSNRFRGNN